MEQHYIGNGFEFENDAEVALDFLGGERRILDELTTGPNPIGRWLVGMTRERQGTRK